MVVWIPMKFFPGSCQVTSAFIFLKINIINVKIIRFTKFGFFIMFREIATEEVDHLFAASDDDHDNRLSFQEILDHHHIFVGSEATDYGDHLKDIERFTDEL